MENSFESDSELNRYLDRKYWEQKQVSGTGGRTSSESENTAVVDSLRGPMPSAPASVMQIQSTVNQPAKMNEVCARF